MIYVLDTNVAVALLRGTPPVVRQRFSRAVDDGETLQLSSIVLFELWHGVARSARSHVNRGRLEEFLAGGLEVLPFDAVDAETAGELRASLERVGTPIGPYDILIAAQALRHRATLVTANKREFARVPNLSWEDWTESAP